MVFNGKICFIVFNIRTEDEIFFNLKKTNETVRKTTSNNFPI